jgi:hypothetical protein
MPALILVVYWVVCWSAWPSCWPHLKQAPAQNGRGLPNLDVNQEQRSASVLVVVVAAMPSAALAVCSDVRCIGIIPG